MRSRDAGDFSTIADGYLRKTVEIRNEIKVEHGEAYKFALLGNPSKKVLRGDRRGKRVGLLGDGARREWAARQLKNAGFDPIRVECVGSQWIRSPRGLVVLAVEYRGVAVVQDAAAAQSAVEQGIGSGKAWGCGMLLLT